MSRLNPNEEELIRKIVFEWQLYWSKQEEHYQRFTRLCDANMKHDLANRISESLGLIRAQTEAACGHKFLEGTECLICHIEENRPNIDPTLKGANLSAVSLEVARQNVALVKRLDRLVGALDHAHTSMTHVLTLGHCGTGSTRMMVVDSVRAIEGVVATLSAGTWVDK